MTQAHPTLSLSISQALQILCGEAYGKELEGKELEAPEYHVVSFLLQANSKFFRVLT